LTAIYLEGALRRTLNPPVVPAPIEVDRPAFEGPASIRREPSRVPTRDAVLDPFAVYEKEGEEPLRRRLAALSEWHLVNIVEAYGLTRDSTTSLNRLTAPALIDRIVAGVRPAGVRKTRRIAR
jgi:hypothetical protein